MTTVDLPPQLDASAAKAQLADKYNHFAGKAQRWGLVQEEDGTIQNYVTRKTLDGLYLVIGQQEQLLRANPAKASSDLLRKVLPESVTPIAADLESHRIHLHKGRFPVLAPDLSFNA